VLGEIDVLNQIMYLVAFLPKDDFFLNKQFLSLLFHQFNERNPASTNDTNMILKREI